MPASFEMRGTAVTHDPNLRLDSSLGKLPAFDPIKLLEGFVDMFIEIMEDIPILGDLVKVLKDLLDTNGNGHLELEDLLGLLTGRGILDGLAALFGGGGGLPFGDIFSGLQQMFGGLTPGGKFDAGELIGELPMTIINTIKGFLSAVFDLGLLRITPNMIFGGNSDNLLLSSDFKAAESMVVGDGWFWDGSVGRSAPGSAKAAASGNRLVQLSNLIRVEPGQKLDVAGWVKWSGVSASGDAFRVECQCYNGASSAASLPVGVISSPAASGGWQQINGQVTIPASVEGVRVRIAVEAAVTAGSVWWDDVSAVRVGTMPQNFITNLVPDLANLFDWLENLVDSILDRLEIPIIGDLLDKIFDVADGVGNIRADTDDTKADLTDLLGDLLSNPAAVIGTLPQTLISGLAGALASLLPKSLFDTFLGGLGNSAGTGAGGSTGIPGVDDALDWIGSLFGKADTAQTTANTVQGTVQQQAVTTGTADGLTVVYTAITASGTWNRSAIPSGCTERVKIGVGLVGSGQGGSKPATVDRRAAYGTSGSTRTYTESPVVSGGVGGGYIYQEFDPATVGTSQTVTIGAGGTGATSAGSAGGYGGTTSFGSLLSVASGTGGGVSTSVGVVYAGSAGDGGASGTNFGRVDGQGAVFYDYTSGVQGQPAYRVQGGNGGTGNGGNGAAGQNGPTDDALLTGGSGGGGGAGGSSSGGAGGAGGLPGGGGGAGGGGTSPGNGGNGGRGEALVAEFFK